MAFAEYDDYDGLGLAHLVRRGEVSPLELLEEAIARIERHNPKLNAVVYKAYDEARATAKTKLPDGPFKGVPFLIKDIGMAVKDWPMTNGSAYLRNYVTPLRRRTHAALSRGGRGADGQNQHAGIRHSGNDRRPPSRHLPQSVESRSLFGRFVGRCRIGGRLRHGADGAWQRWLGLDPHPVRAMRPLSA